MLIYEGNRMEACRGGLVEGFPRSEGYEKRVSVGGRTFSL